MATLRTTRQSLSIFTSTIRATNRRIFPLRNFTTSPQCSGILNLEDDPGRKTGLKLHQLLTDSVRAQSRPRLKQSLKRTATVYPSPRSARHHCPEPLKTVDAYQISLLDPTGARTRLFSPSNPEAAKVGDILLVRQKSGDPFAGVCLNIRKAGAETAILLRNQVMRVGVEMWYKIYSPSVVGIEVVQKRVKRARRARLYYMRKPRHDIGSVQNIVTQYVRQRQMLRAGGDTKGRDANAGKRRQKLDKKK